MGRIVVILGGFIAVLVVAFFLITGGGPPATEPPTFGQPQVATAPPAAAPTLPGRVPIPRDGQVQDAPAAAPAAPANAPPAAPPAAGQQAAAPAPAPDLAPGTPAPAATVERIGALADAIRAAGYEVAHGDVTLANDVIAIADVVISNPDDALAWRWTAQRLLVGDLDGAKVAVQPVGTQTIAYTSGGEEHALGLVSPRLRIDLGANDAGRIRSVDIEVTDLEVRPAGDGDPSTAKRILLRLVRGEGEGLLPDASTLHVEIDNLVTAADAKPALGPTIEKVVADIALKGALGSLDLATATAAWRSAGGGLTVSDLSLTWGLLVLQAKGEATLDEAFRPAGRLEATVTNFLPALDALHAARGFAPEVLADYYATLIQALMASGGDVQDFVIGIADGNVTFTRPQGDLPDLILGTVSPVLPLPPTAP